MTDQADRRCSVVVVEDNADTRELLKELLELWGHSVVAVGDGRAGVAAIVGARPAVALVDLGLPDIHGLEVAAQVRRALGRGVVRLVALTGFGPDDIAGEAAAAGFDAQLTKPPALEALAALLGPGRGAGAS